MTAPQPGPSWRQFSAAVESLKLQVDRDTVLQARAALLSEALRLKQALRAHDSHIGLCGGDPVSADARDAFNERISALLGHCRQYTDDLEAAALALEETARRYGYTDDQIAQSFVT